MDMDALAILFFVAALAGIAVALRRALRTPSQPAQGDAPVTHMQFEGSHEDIADWMWSKLVPESGQCASVQGELLRAVSRLQREAMGNGNINWGDGHEKFIDFLQEHLVEKSTLSDDAKLGVLADLNRLRNFLPVDQFEDPAQFEQLPCVDPEVYDRLTSSVVEYCRLNTRIIPREIDPGQYL